MPKGATFPAKRALPIAALFLLKEKTERVISYLSIPPHAPLTSGQIDFTAQIAEILWFSPLHAEMESG